MVPAMYSEPSGGGRVNCLLCPHLCTLNEGQTGVCGVRKNIGGNLFSLNSDRVVAVHSDPIEKKPLYHFLPGSTSLSIAASGCNFRCRFCQNHSISMVTKQNGVQGEPLSPEEIVESARRARAGSISFTYTEPTVYFELMVETAMAAKEAGIRNVMVSNGFISEKPLEKILTVMDGANIDLKAFSDQFYREQCGGKLEPVLDTIRTISRSACWIEVTTLLIPGLNTDRDEIESMIAFMRDTGPRIPWHVSRFFPAHKTTGIGPTDPVVIKKMLENAEEAGIVYLYGGNFDSGKWEDTRCHACGATLISRSGYRIEAEAMREGRCARCDAVIPGIWN